MVKEINLWSHREFEPSVEVSSLDDAARRLLGLWGNYYAENVFKVCWLIGTQLKEMRDAGWTKESARKELCDIMAICIRELAHLGYDPGEVLMERIGTRHDGQIDAIYERYEKMFRDELGPTYEALEKLMGEG